MTSVMQIRGGKEGRAESLLRHFQMIFLLSRGYLKTFSIIHSISLICDSIWEAQTLLGLCFTITIADAYSLDEPLIMRPQWGLQGY